MHLALGGEANDYVGKGLAGGDIVIKPFHDAAYAGLSHRNVILGNTALYGATGGTLFAAGRAGDRFAVRNSGAIAVIEGAGSHCCEYMTGGTVDRKSTRLNSSHSQISYAVFCLKKKKNKERRKTRVI